MKSNKVVDSYYQVVAKTSLQPADKLSAMTGNMIYIKREDLQPIHSFKIRGAYNKIARLTADELSRGVVTASAGNHAQGVALSAQKLGTSAIVVMPFTTPIIKINAVKGYGGEVVLHGDSYSDAYSHSQEITKQTGRIFIHPFDDSSVIAGQGQIGLEILEQLPGVEYVFVPIGGGGLAAGVARAIKQSHPDVNVIGVEPLDSDAMQQSLLADARVTLASVGIFADGVAVKQVGKHTFDLVRQYVDEVITVSTDELCDAMKYIFEDTRAIVEPAGALAVAGSLKYAAEHKLQSRNIVTINSGANMSFEKLRFVAERAVAGSGKEVLLAVELPETPGALLNLCEQVVNGLAITEFNYRLHGREQAQIFVGIMVGDSDEKAALFASLSDYGYKYSDLSRDDIAKDHIRRMIGGANVDVTNERLYEVIFPERPAALRDFLRVIGVEHNITLFNFRSVGGDSGRVLIGFETDSPEHLESKLDSSNYEYQPVHSRAVELFLRS